MLSEWEQIEGRIVQPRESVDLLRIGAIESVLHTWLIPWLNQCKAVRPTLKLELTVNTAEVG